MTQPHAPDPQLLALFRQEIELHTEALSNGLLDWEKDASNLSKIEPLMRAAHSLKGAARLVGFSKFSDLAHVLEDCFVAAQEKRITLKTSHYDIILNAIDLLNSAKDFSDEQILNWPQDQAEFEKIKHALLEIHFNKKTEQVGVSVPEEKSSKLEALETHSTAEKSFVEGGQFAIFLVFSNETLAQVKVLKEILEKLKVDPFDLKNINALVTAAIAIKGVSIISSQDEAAAIAMKLEQAFTKVSKEELVLDANEVAGLLKDVERLEALAIAVSINPEPTKIPSEKKKEIKKIQVAADDQFVRVSSRGLSRMMGYAAEALVESRRLDHIKQGLLKVKMTHRYFNKLIEELLPALANFSSSSDKETLTKDVNFSNYNLRTLIQEQIDIFDEFYRNTTLLSTRMYKEVLSSRMRPFDEGIRGFPRLIRSLCRSLGKEANLEIIGKEVPVDRDILEKLESPLNHILRNAVDHGIELPEVRKKIGKSEIGTIKIAAHHSGGILQVTISDDGKGIDKEKIRSKILKKGLVTQEMTTTLSDDELYDFLFLPGFSTAEQVTDISGRGVGLDVVRNLMQEIGGSVHINSKFGKGATFYLQLPITRSVLRALLVAVDEDLYAFPISRITSAMRVPRNKVETLEKKEYFHLEGQNISIIDSRQALGFESEDFSDRKEISVVVIGNKESCLYSVIVDQIIGETELVVRPLNNRLGKVPCVSASSLTDEGDPVLIIDIDDLLKSVERNLSSEAIGTSLPKRHVKQKVKSILIVDDSLTVRETEKQILLSAGYNVTLAFDGMDGWNTLRSDKFDLVVTDIDMPRMNGFELVEHIRKDPTLKATPVIIVSYKDRDTDRIKGMEVGADYYLTKSSFRDESFINAVKDLIGDAIK